VTIQPRRKRRQVRPAQIAKAVDEGRESLDLYLDEISRVPLLSRDEEMALARKAFRGNIAAQEKLARHNVRFVVSVAKKFQNRGVPLVDLIGEGNLGLMTAARKFDPDRGVKFISYAVWWIRQAVQAGDCAPWPSGQGAAQPHRRPESSGAYYDPAQGPAGADAHYRGAGSRHWPHCGGGS
jgi:DNA-directed RNA polymerase sigma subunit (sigma70/sigma32)